MAPSVTEQQSRQRSPDCSHRTLGVAFAAAGSVVDDAGRGCLLVHASSSRGEFVTAPHCQRVRGGPDGRRRGQGLVPRASGRVPIFGDQHLAMRARARWGSELDSQFLETASGCDGASALDSQREQGIRAGNKSTILELQDAGDWAFPASEIADRG